MDRGPEELDTVGVVGAERVESVKKGEEGVVGGAVVGWTRRGRVIDGRIGRGRVPPLAFGGVEGKAGVGERCP